MLLVPLINPCTKTKIVSCLWFYTSLFWYLILWNFLWLNSERVDLLLFVLQCAQAGSKCTIIHCSFGLPKTHWLLPEITIRWWPPRTCKEEELEEGQDCQGRWQCCRRRRRLIFLIIPLALYIVFLLKENILTTNSNFSVLSLHLFYYLVGMFIFLVKLKIM